MILDSVHHSLIQCRKGGGRGGIHQGWIQDYLRAVVGPRGGAVVGHRGAESPQLLSYTTWHFFKCMFHS